MTFAHVLATWLVHEIAEAAGTMPLEVYVMWVAAPIATAFLILSICRGGHPRSRREF